MAEPIFEYLVLQSQDSNIIEADLRDLASKGWIINYCKTTCVDGRLWWSVVMQRDADA